MAVTSTTLAGVNVFQFSGAVTDAEIKTAWASLITNGVYVLNRAIYLDSTADLTGVQGGFLVDFGTQVLPAFILHNSRDKTKSTFNNFTFLQRTGLIVNQRSGFVQTTNGTSLANAGSGLSTDGLSLKGGGFVYGVVGNPGGADPRYLNEMAFAGLDGVTIYSQEFTEQELQPCTGATTVLRGLTYEKAYGFPQISTPTGNVNVTVYRSNQNTQSLDAGGLIPIRLFPAGNRYASVCYVDSYVTRNGGDILTRLINGFGTNASNPACLMILNNYTRGSWFGTSKTVMAITTWSAANFIYGGVLKKLQFVNGGGGVVRCYDSRSTTTAQKCKFAETGFFDFVDTNLAPTTDGDGKITLVHIGAIASGATAAIARYTDQRYTFQKFGYRVMVGTPDMTSGDNDLSAFSPITLTTQDGIVRTQAEINAATSVTSFQDLLEELHVIAIGLSGSSSYAGAYSGNLFTYVGDVLTTAFTTVNIDPTAASKISYNAATNTLTLKTALIGSNSAVATWNNPTGTINLLNGAQIQGIYQSSAGTSTTFRFESVQAGSSLVIYDASGVTKYYQGNITSAGDYNYYIPPGTTGTYYWAIEKYGKQRESGSFAANTGGLLFYTPLYVEDVGITQTTQATVAAYTTLETNSKLYDYIAYFRLSEQGIKLGQIATRSGTSIEFGSYSGIVKATHTSVLSISGSTITIKANGLAGDTKYSTIIATPPATWTADTTEVITTEIEDGNGDSSITIEASSVSTFEIWKITDATDPDDYATGTLVDTVGIGKFRFLHANGYKFVIRDTTTNYRVVVEAEKGTYMAQLFFGAAVQLAQAAEVSQINTKVDIMAIDLDAIKGTGFTKNKHSLTNIRKKAALAAALSA